MKNYSPRIWIITGSREVGKTRFCTHLVERALQMKLDVAGVLSPPIFSGSTKTVIEVENLRTHERKLLATTRLNDPKSTTTQRWSFDDEVLKWGNQILAHAVPCELLVVDELGMLEFDRDQGWLNGLTALNSGQFQVAVVVIRPELVSKARTIFIDSDVIEIPAQLDLHHETELINKILTNI